MTHFVDGNGYTTYFRYSEVKKIISKRQCTAEQLINKTSFTQATIYRILNGLLANNKIVMVKTKRPGKYYCN